MSREHKKRDKRRRLLKAARKIFSEKGYEKATVDQIVEEAQVAKGTFYLYFKNKYELFMELIKHLEKHYHKLREQLTKLSDVREKLNWYAEKNLKFLKENRQLARIGILNYEHLDNDIKEWFINMQTFQIETIKGVVKEGQAVGEFRDINPRSAALGFVGILNHYALHFILRGEEDFDVKKAAETILDLFINGVQKV